MPHLNAKSASITWNISCDNLNYDDIKISIVWKNKSTCKISFSNSLFNLLYTLQEKQICYSYDASLE